jgi:hypothetical protein
MPAETRSHSSVRIAAVRSLDMEPWLSVKPQIRILIVDDHVLFREGLARLLSCEPDLLLKGQCGTGAEAMVAL